jgi:IS5 family transposase
VSLFEDHTDILRKDRRETLYGHKICLASGASSLILDCLILAGNPADSSLAETMIERQIDIYGRAPRQAAFDGGFTSKANLAGLKRQGVEDVAFSKHRGLEIGEMTRSAKVYRQLRHFRARHRGRHLLAQARLRPRPLHLAQPALLPRFRLELDPQLQPARPRTPPAAVDAEGS